VDAVESAAKLPNGDIVLTAKGRLAGDETEKSSSFALVISAQEIQAAREQLKERQKTPARSCRSASCGFYVPEIRCEMKSAQGEGGESLQVFQNLATDNAAQSMGTGAAAVCVIDKFQFPFPQDAVGFRDRVGIVYVEKNDDGSIFQGIIKPDAKNIQKSRRKNLWWLPLAVVGDVVLLPVEVVGGVVVIVVAAANSS
jgi:hypothetical protein